MDTYNSMYAAAKAPLMMNLTDGGDPARAAFALARIRISHDVATLPGSDRFDDVGVLLTLAAMQKVSRRLGPCFSLSRSQVARYCCADPGEVLNESNDDERWSFLRNEAKKVLDKIQRDSSIATIEKPGQPGQRGKVDSATVWRWLEPLQLQPHA